MSSVRLRFALTPAFMKDPTASWSEFAVVHEMTVFLLLIWNSQYFGARVIGNYHVRVYQAEQKQLMEKQAATLHKNGTVSPTTTESKS